MFPDSQLSTIRCAITKDSYIVDKACCFLSGRAYCFPHRQIVWHPCWRNDLQWKSSAWSLGHIPWSRWTYFEIFIHQPIICWCERYQFFGMQCPIREIWERSALIQNCEWSEKAQDKFQIKYIKLSVFISDSCNAMRGRDSGAVALLMDEWPWMVDSGGCGTHQVNLIKKTVVETRRSFKKCSQFSGSSLDLSSKIV